MENNMKEPDFDKEIYEPSIDLLRDEVTNATQYIEAEFARETGNTWPNCVITRISAMYAFADMAVEEGDLEEAEALGIKTRLKSATDTARVMQAKYNTPEALIPDQEKERMLAMLRILD